MLDSVEALMMVLVFGLTLVILGHLIAPWVIYPQVLAHFFDLSEVYMWYELFLKGLFAISFMRCDKEFSSIE